MCMSQVLEEVLLPPRVIGVVEVVQEVPRDFVTVRRVEHLVPRGDLVVHALVCGLQAATDDGELGGEQSDDR